MATFQDVRGYFEKATFDALRTGTLPAADIHFDNFGETAAPADRDYAIVSLTFGNSIEDVIGCEGKETLIGTLQCNIYTTKQEGSVRGEELSLSVLKAWNAINKRGTDHKPLIHAKCLNIEGPITIAPDQRPHHANVVSCSFRAMAA